MTMVHKTTELVNRRRKIFAFEGGGCGGAGSIPDQVTMRQTAGAGDGIHPGRRKVGACGNPAKAFASRPTRYRKFAKAKNYSRASLRWCESADQGPAGCGCINVERIPVR